MPTPQQWPRDSVDSDPLFESKKHTDEVHQFLEALGAVEVLGGKWTATLRKVVLAIDPPAAASWPLKLIASANEDGDPVGDIIYGTVAGLDVMPSPTAVSDGDHGYVRLTVSWDSDTGLWSASAAAFEVAASVPAPDATNAFLNCGYFTVAGGVATAHPALNGSQGWQRCGTGTTYADNFFGGGL